MRFVEKIIAKNRCILAGAIELFAKVSPQTTHIGFSMPFWVIKLNPYFINDSSYFLINCDFLFELEFGLCSIFSSSLNFSGDIWLVLKTTDGKRLFKKNKNNYEGPLKKDPQYAKYRPFSI